MINTIRSEFIKLRTVRMNFVIFFLAVGLPVVICGLTALLVRNVDEFTDDGITSLVSGTSVLAALQLAVMGAASITGEFGFRTIRPTFAATPNRAQVLVAKVVVISLVAAVTQALLLAACSLGMRAIISLRGGEVAAFEPYLSVDENGVETLVTYAPWPPVIGGVLFAVLVSLFGLAVGSLVRHTVGAVAIVLLWPLLIESLLAGLLTVAGIDRVERFLPYVSGINMALPTSDIDGFGRVGGGLFFAAVVAAVGILGTVVTLRRDA